MLGTALLQYSALQKIFKEYTVLMFYIIFKEGLLKKINLQAVIGVYLRVNTLNK